MLGNIVNQAYLNSISQLFSCLDVADASWLEKTLTWPRQCSTGQSILLPRGAGLSWLYSALSRGCLDHRSSFVTFSVTVSQMAQVLPTRTFGRTTRHCSCPRRKRRQTWRESLQSIKIDEALRSLFSCSWQNRRKRGNRVSPVVVCRPGLALIG